MKNKKLNRKCLKRISAAIMAIAVLMVTVFLSVLTPNSYAATITKDIDGLKKSLYATAAYNCIDNNGYLESELATGSPKYSILSAGADVSVYIGQWLGDANGMITCKDAFNNFNKLSGNIGDKDIKSGGIFENVYTYSTKAERRISCSYAIINSESTAYINNGQEYTWPQGYYRDGDGNIQSNLTAPPIWVYYNEDGWVGKVSGGPSGMNPNLGEETKRWTFQKDEAKLCNIIVAYLEVYPIDTYTLHGDPVKGYSEVISSDDPTPFSEWGIHVDDSYAAHLSSLNGHYKYTAEDVADTSKIVLKDNGLQQLLTNIKNSYFGGKTPEDFIKSDSGFMYALTARYIFNGDGGFAAGCGGITVAKSDKNFDKLDPAYWDPSLSYVADVTAYKNVASSKSEYRTKFGGSLKEAGASKTVQYAPWSESYVDCDALAGQFNGYTTSSNAIKKTVWKWINPVSVEEIPTTTTTGTNTHTGPGNQEDDETSMEEACFAEAGSLGWIICPIIFGLKDIVDGIYSNIEPLIQVNSSIVNQMGDSNSGLYSAWNTFRGLANIMFVILFLIIIFSQLTGYGIDNYGIKKMLPKLIVTAILVNFSFWLCAIVIDISNIVGSGIRTMLESINVGGNLGNNSVSGFKTQVMNVFNFFTLIGTSAGVVAGGAAIAYMLNGWAIIIPILLFLLTALVAIIFAFIVLGLRQAAVILCVVLAPFAIALKLLPNTEKAYRRWVEIFKGVLLVYPIVGALIGAGFFASKVLLSGSNSGSFFMTIIGALLCVVPYFLIPSLVKKSLAAAGDIGNRVANFGKEKAAKGRNFVNGLDAVKDAKYDSSQLAAQKRAQRFMQSKRGQQIGKDIKAGKKVSLRDANRYQRAANRAIATNNASVSARQAQSQYNRMSTDSGFDAAMSAAEMAEDDIATKNYETMILAGDYIGNNGEKVNQNSLDALEAELVSEMTKPDGDDAKIRALTNRMLANGSKGVRKVDSAFSKAIKGNASANTIQKFASNIKNNHADVADKMPKLFESSLVASANGTFGDKKSYAEFNNEGIGSLNAGKMARLDKEQLKQYLNKDQTGFADYMGKDQRAQLATLAAQALSDERLKGDINVDNEPLLRAIAAAGNQQVVQKPSMEGDSGKIHQSATPTAAPTIHQPISDETRRRVAETGRTGGDAVEEAIDKSNKGGGHTTDSGIWLPS